MLQILLMQYFRCQVFVSVNHLYKRLALSYCYMLTGSSGPKKEDWSSTWLKCGLKININEI